MDPVTAITTLVSLVKTGESMTSEENITAGWRDEEANHAQTVASIRQQQEAEEMRQMLISLGGLAIVGMLFFVGGK